MTDAEIIKALEICGDNTIEDGHCGKCPCRDACYGEEGIHALENAALDLIKRQQAEIEKLKNSRDRWKQLAKDFDEASREEEKEVERGGNDDR